MILLYKKRNALITAFVVLQIFFASSILATDISFEPADYPETEVGSMDNNLDLINANPIDTAIFLVNIISTLLGFAFLALILYAGAIWMLARGNEEEVTKAQNIIKRSLIGLIIVLLSTSIAYLMYWLITGATVQANYGVQIFSAGGQM